MKTRGLSFTSENVLKVIDGRKVQTRRVMKPQPRRMVDNPDKEPMFRWRAPIGTHCYWGGNTPPSADHSIFLWSPCGKPGDRIWVREAFAYSMKDPDSAFDAPPSPETHDVVYRATSEGTGAWEHCEEVDGKLVRSTCAPPWRPARHMPRWASRITLELVEVRVQRLQAISATDIRAEGITCAGDTHDELHCEYKPGVEPCPGLLAGSPGRQGFIGLWNEINRKGLTWGDDPWVWAYTFKRVEAR